MADHSWLWVLIAVVFVVALGAALAYGSGKWRQFQRDPRGAAERDRATRQLFKADRASRRG